MNEPLCWNSIEMKKAAETFRRAAARHCESPPQRSRLLTQKLKPDSSGSRPRKSRYCWRTKYSVVSNGFKPSLVAVAVKEASVCCPSWLKLRCDGLRTKFARDGVTV